MTDESSGATAWHRIGGYAEQLHDRRVVEGHMDPGRWCAPPAEGMIWREGKVGA